MSTSVHHSGCPVSYGSYVRGCRCEGFAAKQAAYYEEHKAEIAAKRAAYREEHKAEIAAKRDKNYYREAARRRYLGQSAKGLAAELRDEADRDVSQAVEVEMALARGCPITQIMADHNLDYASVKDIRDRMAS